VKRKTKTNVWIRKELAARRQLDTAIQLYFQNDDALSIQTLAVAAFGILRDLNRKRGRHHFTDLMAAGLWEMAQNYRTGNQDEIPEDVRSLVEDIARKQSSGQIKSPRDIQIGNVGHLEKEHWDKFAESSNFLKHADKDSLSALAESEINNEEALSHACAAYVRLLRSLSPEMAVFVAYDSCEESKSLPRTSSAAPIAKKLKTVRSQHRRSFCRKLLHSQKFRRLFENP
jgi:hypothetical protein